MFVTNINKHKQKTTLQKQQDEIREEIHGKKIYLLKILKKIFCIYGH